VTYYDSLDDDYDLPELDKGAHLVELKGSPGALTWPDICPNCGAPASERVKVRKVFGRHTQLSSESRSYSRFLIRSATIPLCAACAQRHRELLRVTMPQQALFRILRNPAMLAAYAAIAFAVFAFRRLVVGSGEPQHGLAIIGFFLLVALFTFSMVWWHTRTDFVPPLTEIARACDWSDNLGNLLTGERHAYAIRNAAFTQALAFLNGDRFVSATDRKRFQNLNVVYGLSIFAALAAAALLLGRLRTHQ